MIGRFSVDDGTILCGLLADGAGDVLLKTDGNGFVTEASPGLEAFGLNLGEILFAPHVADLVRPCHAEAVRTYCSDVLAGIPNPDRVEFPAAGGEALDAPERWYALSLRPNVDQTGAIAGSVGIMRSIEPRRSIEDELLVASMTDQLTGLANRQAFMSIMSRYLGFGGGGAVILFGIDRFRAITLRYGQSKGDDVLWAFAQFLRAMLGEDPILTRMGGERFAVILPEIEPVRAQAIAEEAVTTFARLSNESGCEQVRVSASAGIAAMANERDQVLASAELALTLAQAAGGTRAQLGRDVPIMKERRRSA